MARAAANATIVTESGRMSEKIAQYLSLQAKKKALDDQLKAVEAAIKAGMEAQGVSEVRDGGFVARVVEGNQRKFDTARFKVEHPDFYESYRKDVPTHSFQAFVES